MYTPPRNGGEQSWLHDQSPVRGGTRTPPQNYSTSTAPEKESWKGLKADLWPETPESGTPTLINPTSTLLQGLLKEERAHRGSRGSLYEDGRESPRTPDRSRFQDDNISEKARKASQATAVAQSQPKDMGVREMDQVRVELNL